MDPTPGNKCEGNDCEIGIGPTVPPFSKSVGLKSALQVLFQFGMEPYLEAPYTTILQKPFQFVKSKKSARDKARIIFDTVEYLTYPQEGYRQIYALGPIDERELPRVIWVKLEPGLWGGWSRNRVNQRLYKKYRDWQKVTPGAPVLKGKTA